MKRLFIAISAFVFAGFAIPATAADSVSEHFRTVPSEAVRLRTDRAYIVMKCIGKSVCGVPMLLRLPTVQENEIFRAAKLEAWKKKGSKVPFEKFPFELRGLENLYQVDLKKPFSTEADVITYLLEADPGTYVVYGVGNKYSMTECLCLGTVQFSAKAGEVTTLGMFLFGRASIPSATPELAEVTNLGPTYDMDFPLLSVALSPAPEHLGIPATLQRMRSTPAQLQAVGPFLEPSARLITRLAPIPSVLAYHRGTVIDVRTGRVAPER